MSIDVPARLARGLKAIRRHVAHFSRPITQDIIPLPTLLMDQATHELVDFAHAQGVFYGRHAGHYARDQVQRVFEEDNAIHLPVTILLPEDSLLFEFGSVMDQKLSRPVMHRPIIANPTGKRYFVPKNYAPKMVSFGIGMGAHVEPLLETFEMETLILCETDPVVLAAALVAQDWDKILATAKAKGVRIEFIFEPDGETCAYAVLNTIRKTSAAATIGARAFMHHQVGEMGRAIATFKLVMDLLATPSGYFADESRQVLQARKNIVNTPVICRPGAALPPHIGVAVVGSGPSLDSCLDILRALRDRIYLISAGTGLTPLVKAGLIPDAHVELETHSQSEMVIKAQATREILEALPLLGSVSMYPPALELFRTKYLYPRMHSSSSAMFGRAAAEVQGAFSRAGNAAVANALHLGFRQVMLFGMDSGFRKSQLAHAKNSFYEGETIKQIEAEAQKDYANYDEVIRRDLSRTEQESTFAEVPGITNEMVAIDQTFAFSLSKYAELAIAFPDAKIYQIGFGARIKGAINMTPEHFQKVIPPFKRAGGIEDIFRRTNPRSDLAPIYASNMRQASKVAIEILREIRTLMGRHIAGPIEFVRLDQKIHQRLDLAEKAGGPSLAAAGLLRGSFLAFSRAIMERALLTDDLAERTQIIAAGAETICEMAQELIHRIRSAFEEVPRDAARGLAARAAQS